MLKYYWLIVITAATSAVFFRISSGNFGAEFLHIVYHFKQSVFSSGMVPVPIHLRSVRRGTYIIPYRIIVLVRSYKILSCAFDRPASFQFGSGADLLSGRFIS